MGGVKAQELHAEGMQKAHLGLVLLMVAPWARTILFCVKEEYYLSLWPGGKSSLYKQKLNLWKRNKFPGFMSWVGVITLGHTLNKNPGAHPWRQKRPHQGPEQEK